MKNKLFIIFIFIVGIFLRLYPAFKQPLWLDEIYSLYFASNFSPLKIIFSLPESHSGGYYLILKLFFYISTNPIFLRLMTSVVPELVGCYIIYRCNRNRYLIAAILLNPFFIHISWQLRMYGFTFLFSTILLLILISNKKHFRKILLLGIVSTLFSFSLVIPLLCACIYLFFNKKEISQLSLLIIIPIEFLIIKGLFTFKNYAELASWISTPSFINIPSTILTMLGVNTDINNIGSSSLIISIIFFVIFTSLIYLMSKSKKMFIYIFTLPLIITIFISILFPFLSQHFFFYKFIPNLSLFIPRFLLPLSIYFFIFLFTSIKNKFQLPVLIIFVLLWIKPSLVLNFQQLYKPAFPLSYSSESLILPPWENLRLNNNFSASDLKQISKKYEISLAIEKEILNYPQKPNCQILKKYSSIVYIDQNIKNLQKYQDNIKQTIKNCIKSL